MSNAPGVATVFGGSGFVGRHVVRALARRGYRIRVAVRRPDLAYDLKPLGNVGQIKPVQANVRVRWSVERAVEGVDLVINAVGILRESGRQKFAAVQEMGAQYVAEAASAAGARLVHVSAIGADADSSVPYAATKGSAEQAVLTARRDAIILRPSVVFGPQDDFFNRFAALARFSPFLPLIGGGNTLFQPVYVDDVAEAVARAADGALDGGKTYELGGPQVVTFRDCMEIVMAETDRQRLLLPLPWFAARAFARLTGWLPGAPLTLDEVRLLENDNIVSQAAIRGKNTLEGIGIAPTAMAAILPTYLWRFRPQGQFSRKGEA